MSTGVSALVALCVAMCQALDAPTSRTAVQEDAEVRLEVLRAPRPLAEAVRQIEDRFGRVVTYEDGSYVAADDMVDVTEQVRRDGKTDRRVRVMRSDSISLAYTPTGPSVDAQVREVLTRLLAQWNRPPHSGRFRLDEVVGGYHVVPVARKGKDGDPEPYTSPLDTPITIRPDERDGVEFMTLLAEAISTSSGRRVIEGAMPMNRLRQAKVVLGADNQTAREVLWKALQAIDPALSWQFLCEVGEDPTCALNIHYAGAADRE